MHARSTEARSVDCKLRSQSFVGWLAFNKADRLDLSCPLIRPAPVPRASGGGLGYGGQNNIWKYKKKSSPDKRRVFYTLDLRHLFASSAERYILYPLTAAAPGAAAGTHGMAHTTTTTTKTPSFVTGTDAPGVSTPRQRLEQWLELLCSPLGGMPGLIALPPTRSLSLSLAGRDKIHKSDVLYQRKHGNGCVWARCVGDFNPSTFAESTALCRSAPGLSWHLPGVTRMFTHGTATQQQQQPKKPPTHNVLNQRQQCAKQC